VPLVARFGERILAAPPQRGFGLVAWLTPPAFVLAGLIWMVLRLWSRRPPACAASPPIDAPALRRRLEHELRAW
jgi:cytochrome c-type biogenesis protein CcmH/NrfF